jgi:Rrf2 family protein
MEHRRVDGLRAVRVPAGVDDALRALVVIAAAAPRPVKAREICEAEGLSYRFLSTVLIALRTAGLVTSSRGRDGGYALAVPAEELTVATVFGAVDPRAPHPVPGSAATGALWASLERDVRDRLAALTLAELLPPA